MHISKAVIFPTMKKLTLALLLTLSCATAWAADFDKGLAAAEAGDYTTALSELKPFAEQGNAVAQLLLGFMYRDGLGVIENDEEAFRWFRLAAEQGVADAQNSLGGMYEKGKGVIEDDKKAAKWRRLAAEQGHAQAQLVLGVMYEDGVGVIEDNKEAVKWYRLAAEQGNAKAQSRLGFAYILGLGVIQDSVYAHMWWNIAGANGYEKARGYKGDLVKEMTPQDISKAQDLARECVKKNYKDC